VTTDPVGQRSPTPVPGGDAAARARLEELFTSFDRLTPFELERVGLRRRDEAARAALLRDVVQAADAAGRTVLLEEARTRARDTVFRRYDAGGLHPTWGGLNWGISQGTIEDRVAIVEALEDAAAAAVVADLVTPDVVEALTLDAGLVVDMASGEASEGALARQTAPPAAGLRDTRGRWVVAGAAMGGLMGFGLGAAIGGILGGLTGAAVAAGIVVLAVRRRPGDAER
jgi:hypothetical protein